MIHDSRSKIFFNYRYSAYIETVQLPEESAEARNKQLSLQYELSVSYRILAR